MHLPAHQHIIILVCCLLSNLALRPAYAQQANGANTKQAESYLKDYALQPDSVFRAIQSQRAAQRLQGYSKTWVNLTVALAIIHKKRGYYNDAYELLWEALQQAEQRQDSLSQAHIHVEISSIYSLYHQDTESFLHINKAQAIVKQLVASKKLPVRYLAKNYHAISDYHRRAKRYKLALSYLDSSRICQQYNNEEKEKNNYFLPTSMARIYIEMQQYEKAYVQLTRAESIIKESSKSIEVIVYALLGDYFLHKEDFFRAANYYTLSLEAVDKHQNHFDFLEPNLVKLAKINARQTKYPIAYKHMLKAYRLKDSLALSIGKSDKSLFTIKNNVQKELTEQHAKVQEQALEILKKSHANLRLKIGLLALLTFTAAVGFVFYHKYTRKKLEARQEKERAVSKLAQEKMKADISSKNQELTAFTLQLIEKELAVEKLVEFIKKESKQSEKRETLLNQVKQEKKDLWEEFNTRFIEVNGDFYNRLLNQFPDLSPTELKHAALIKLNFNGKEMAHLLNISLNGVHIGRHRLRKKLKLERGENLSVFIANF